MKILVLTFLITFLCITAIALLINYCKKRISKTPHGLTGMCYKNGGSMCSECAEKIKNNKSDNKP